MVDEPIKAYGEGRVRAGVSYSDVERAAIAILKSERRPTVETVREALGTGSPDTIATALKRFWRDLGARIEGDPAALTRMPPDIAELADGMWQRSLRLAAEAAKHDDNAARERLKQIEAENEIRAHSLSLREKEWDAAARERERALADAREHLLLLSKSLGRDQATIQARDARIADLEAQIADYRQQMATLIAGAALPKTSRPRRAHPKTASTARNRKSATTSSTRVKQPRAKRNAGKKTRSAVRHRSPPKTPGRRKR
jgi:hypothetical protein